MYAVVAVDVGGTGASPRRRLAVAAVVLLLDNEASSHASHARHR